MRAAEILKFKEQCREAGLKMECGPSDKSTKVPNAGVGMAVRKDITFIIAEKKTEHSKGHTKPAGWTNTC